jgi:homopolymeric O-antigen transport system permease protein
MNPLSEPIPTTPSDLSAPEQPATATSAAPNAKEEPPVTIIEPRPEWRVIDTRELWRFRELLFFLAWRDVRIRYRQTVLGIAWAVLQPLATMIVFSLFLSGLGNGGASELPYALFALAGLLPWFFFSGAITAAGQSVVGNQNLVTKVYFPRLIIPAAAVLVALVDFAIGLCLLAGMMVYHQVTPGWGLLLAPCIVLAISATALGVGTLLAALTVAYRDFRYVLTFLVQLWMFATPSIYLNSQPSSPEMASLLALNPAHGLIAAFRSAVFGESMDWLSLGISSAVGVALLALGCRYFRRVERSFADII